MKQLFLAILFFSTFSAISSNIDLLVKKAYEVLCAGDIDEALHMYTFIYKQTSALQALYNVCYIKKLKGHESRKDLDEAVEILERIVAEKPDYDDAQFSLGFGYLEQGKYDLGWKQHEHYLRRSGKNGDQLRALIKNNMLEGVLILLHYEGGLGDTLQFIRYASYLKERGAIIHVFVQKPLVPILSLCPYIDKIIVDKELVSQYPVRASLMSLPAILLSELSNPLDNIPYLFVPPLKMDRWDHLFEHKKIKIGLCWQADVYNDSSRLPFARRGIPLNKLIPLLKEFDFRFYSLQKKDGVEQLAELTDDVSLTIFDDSFDETNGSFIDTALVMQKLDLIITIDSAVAHLAGALGRPVWLLLPYATDWRWISGKIDSPWYPTMRIFKQKKPYDWDFVIEQVRIALFHLEAEQKLK